MREVYDEAGALRNSRKPEHVELSRHSENLVVYGKRGKAGMYYT